jgi:hypothetical protein
MIPAENGAGAGRPLVLSTRAAGRGASRVTRRGPSILFLFAAQVVDFRAGFVTIRERSPPMVRARPRTMTDRQGMQQWQDAIRVATRT